MQIGAQPKGHKERRLRKSFGEGEKERANVCSVMKTLFLPRAIRAPSRPWNIAASGGKAKDGSATRMVIVSLSSCRLK